MHLFQMIHDSGSCSFGDFHQNDDILVLVMLLAAGFRRGGNQGLDIPASILTKEELADALMGPLPEDGEKDAADHVDTGESEEKEASDGNQG